MCHTMEKPPTKQDRVVKELIDMGGTATREEMMERLEETKARLHSLTQSLRRRGLIKIYSDRNFHGAKISYEISYQRAAKVKEIVEKFHAD